MSVPATLNTDTATGRPPRPPRWIPLSLFAVAGIAVLTASGAAAAGSADPRVPDQQSQARLTIEQCEKLIDELASRNTPPVLKTDRTDAPTYPSDFDKSDEDRVVKAYDALGARVEELLPHLVKHADDDRHSYTAESPSGYWSNNSVGFACRSILRENVAIYVPLVRRSTWLSKSGFPTTPRDIERWWADQKGKSLWELQLNWLEWALAEERKTTFDSAQEEAAIIGGLQRAIEKLKETKKPIQSGKRLVLRPK